jgi:hypothetical protein
LGKRASSRDSVGVSGSLDAAVSVERHVSERKASPSRQVGNATRRAGVVG